jgi:diketogulonate reductase-like aldo/keto reductase
MVDALRWMLTRKRTARPSDIVDDAAPKPLLRADDGSIRRGGTGQGGGDALRSLRADPHRRSAKGASPSPRFNRGISMEKTTIGRKGPVASAIGLGCMGMSPGIYGASDEAESIATIHAALDAGVTLIDTGDFYGMGHNEMLIRRALEGVPRDRSIISVKFGAMRDPAGGFGGNDGRPQAVKNFLAYTLRRLGTDYIDIYRPARMDPDVPIEDTIGAVADMVRAGYVRHIGLSEVGVETIRRALRCIRSSICRSSIR